MIYIVMRNSLRKHKSPGIAVEILFENVQTYTKEHANLTTNEDRRASYFLNNASP